MTQPKRLPPQNPVIDIFHLVVEKKRKKNTKRKQIEISNIIFKVTLQDTPVTNIFIHRLVVHQLIGRDSSNGSVICNSVVELLTAGAPKVK